MSARKQQLLKRHRRNKRIGLLVALLALLAVGLLVSPWLLPILLVALWVAHEAWFADHLFYSPQQDYFYRFPPDTRSVACTVEEGRLRLPASFDVADAAAATMFLKLHLRRTWLGYWFDPAVQIGDDCQTFERGVDGVRYLNLSGQGAQLRVGDLRLQGRFCRLAAQGEDGLIGVVAPLGRGAASGIALDDHAVVVPAPGAAAAVAHPCDGDAVQGVVGGRDRDDNTAVVGGVAEADDGFAHGASVASKCYCCR